MKTYDFQKATADRIAEIFRKATVGANGREKKTGGQRRVLLADEVGLGKTIMAREVISRVREMRREIGDDMFRVVYVCSNMNIVRQNIENLGVREKLDVSESRLSMQHLIIAKKDNILKNISSGEMPEMLIPLTPGTSFSQNGTGIGNIPERALMAVILSRLEGLKEFAGELFDFFRSGRVSEKSGGWQWFIERYDKEVTQLGSDYILNIGEKLEANTEFGEIKSRIQEILVKKNQTDSEYRKIINDLRRIFADISLSMLEPDLIIMDEFQRFSSLLDYNDDSEQSAIVKKFFDQEGGQEPLILLLSATPYKPFSTLEEIAEYKSDEHYEDFCRLMEFLFKQKNDFREIWSDYSCRISHLKSEKFDLVLASKQAAEDKMYEAMCRTERLNEGLVSTVNVDELSISRDDILSFYEMQKIVSACKEISSKSGAARFHWSVMPVEYVKSAPYLLSFMDSYELKKHIEKVYKENKKQLPVPTSNVLLRARDIMQYHRIPMRNARLQYLRDMMLPKRKEAELLLWVPASIPYYSTNADNPFEKNKDFSKALVFSSWEMVPRMISTMITYEAEREAIFSKYKKASYEKKTGSNRLKKDTASILTYPSEFLASLYDPSESCGLKINSIKTAVRNKLNELLCGIPRTERRNYNKILAVVKWLDNRDAEMPSDIPSNTIDILTDMAIASPGVCLYRILKDKDRAKEAAEGFVTLFNRRIAGYIIDRIRDKSHGDDLYLEGVFDYCVLGNLQAVLDEFRHLCSSDDDFIDRMGEAFIREVPLQVDTFESFYEGNSPKTSMRTFYAVPFSKGKKTADDKSHQRANNIRIAFQSPFYPFVVASTSVGQEGLDFHWYCRKIVHWNLPSNPQDLEQREGRINRYKCLAVRRNLAHRFPLIFNWDELFDNADRKVRQEFGNKYSELVPNWCLPIEWLKDDASTELSADCNAVSLDHHGIEWIERIVPMYPMSNDVQRYSRLIDVLSLYRLTLGQPRQEELLSMLESQNLSPRQIRSLLFNLSPIKRTKGI